MKRFHVALGISDVGSPAGDYSLRRGSWPDLLSHGTYAFWRKDVVNQSIRKAGQEEGGARRGHGSGDVIRQ